jgi:hypothetical protein
MVCDYRTCRVIAESKTAAREGSRFSQVRKIVKEYRL